MAQQVNTYVTDNHANINAGAAGAATLYVFSVGGALQLALKDVTGVAKILNDSTTHPCTFI